MIDRAERCFDLKPKRLAADTAYGTGRFLGWLVKEKKITPHIPVWDMSKRDVSTFSRSDFTFDGRRDIYICPAGKTLKTSGRVNTDHGIRYFLPFPPAAHGPAKRSVVRTCPLAGSSAT